MVHVRSLCDVGVNATSTVVKVPLSWWQQQEQHSHVLLLLSKHALSQGDFCFALNGIHVKYAKSPLLKDEKST